jgi:hypothetical protein
MYNKRRLHVSLSAVVTIIEVDKTTVNKAVKGNLPLITHTNRITILDKYFPKSAIDLSLFTPVVRSHAPKALTAPPSAGPNAVFTEVVDSLDLDQAISGFEMFKLTFSTGSLKLLFLCTDLTSRLSSETNITDIDLPDAVKQSPFARRLILNNSV